MAVPTVDTGPAEPTPGRRERRPRSGKKGGAPPRVPTLAPGSPPPGSGPATVKSGSPSGGTSTPASPSSAPGFVPPVGEPRPGAGLAPMGGPDIGATLPASLAAMAAPAMAALAAISGRYGEGAPSANTGQAYAPPVVGTGAPTGPLHMGGDMGAQYGIHQGNTSRQVEALGSLNVELERILNDAAGSTTHGRAAIGTLIAEVNTALTALGPVADTPAGQQMVIATLGAALQRAGSVLGQGQTSAAISADRVAALAGRYLNESRPQPPAPRRRRRTRPGRRGAGTGPPRTLPPGQQSQWIEEAMRVLAAEGYDTSQIDRSAIAAIIQHESSGNPNAINLWDSNAAAGIPSKGLMQTIDPTFNAYSLPGHRDIWNPVDNIIAGVRYSIDRYGSVSNVPGIASMREGGAYMGY
ncbi:transglycosylase SLT domain-containing protein [Nocardia cyriacigeorgica]|uniref:Transglycosylase SLT domain-containing protein n=1 Tax=Nocardia cyriacigeorgica TaxID=135487 RepID=A0A6P1D4P1_9NOCA|nr:transglycosylase SLT domain-containing protein [Nocardia cyriacigeorgica]NEW44070.1 transglycosylase SLT domain-containing protein [Nocardia cyriacigeorgica]